MSESQIQAKVVHYARHVLGIPAIKLHMVTDVGWPDFLFILDKARTLWAEFKQPDKKLSRVQAARVRSLRALGHEVVIITTYEGGVEALKKALTNGRKINRRYY